MLFLFVGLASSGILARLNLAAARGGWLHQENLEKPILQVLFEIGSTVLGLVAFVAAFTYLNWWVPIAAFVLGYWIVPVIVINQSSFPIVYAVRFALVLISMSCSLLVIYTAVYS